MEPCSQHEKQESGQEGGPEKLEKKKKFQLYRPLLCEMDGKPVYGTFHAVKKFMTKVLARNMKEAEMMISKALSTSTPTTPLTGFLRKKEGWHSLVRSINHGDTIFRYWYNFRFVLVPHEDSLLLVTVENVRPAKERVEREKFYFNI